MNLQEIQAEIQKDDTLVKLDGAYTVTRHYPGAFVEVQAGTGSARQVLDYSRHPDYVKDWFAGVLRVIRQERLF